MESEVFEGVEELEGRMMGLGGDFDGEGEVCLEEVGTGERIGKF